MVFNGDFAPLKIMPNLLKFQLKFKFIKFFIIFHLKTNQSDSNKNWMLCLQKNPSMDWDLTFEEHSFGFGVLISFELWPAFGPERWKISPTLLWAEKAYSNGDHDVMLADFNWFLNGKTNWDLSRKTTRRSNNSNLDG